MFGQYSEGIPDSRQYLPLKTSGKAIALWILAVAAAYFGTAGLSLLFAFKPTGISPVWPPAGFALAAVLLLGYQVSAGIFIGALASNIFTLNITSSPTGPLFIAIFSTAAGNTLEALIGAYLIRRFTGNFHIFKDMKGALVFVSFGALLSAAISALIGVTGLFVLIGNWDLYYSAWFTWWLGDVTGTILIAPLFLSWNRVDYAQWKFGKTVEALLALVLLCLVSFVVYVYNYPLKFLMIPVLLWIILRFELLETSLAVAISSGIAIYGAARTVNPALDGAPNESLLLIQSYVSIVAITALFLSVVVSERKHSAEAVGAEKAFTDTIINSIPGAFYVLDREGQLVRWNHYLAELNDISPKELMGINSLRNIYPEDKEKILSAINKAFKDGESTAEGRICTKDEIHHFLFTGRRVNVEGTPYVVGAGIDITARKSAELQLKEYQRNLEAMVTERTEKLTELNAVLASEIEERRSIEKVLLDSEAKYRNLVEGANSAILRWTKKGNIVFANRFALEFFGYSEETMLGKNIVGTIVPVTESSGRDLSYLAKDIQENPAAYVLNENENIKKNGERVWVAWTNRAITDNEGHIVEILSVGNDITRRKLAEDRLKITLDELAAAKEQAEKADRLKSTFLATMSHELRTPLNSIIGFTGIILKGYVGPLNDEQAKQLGMVRNSANHLLSLINDILDISKIEAGQLTVSFDSFSLCSLLDQVAQSSRPALQTKGLKLSVNISENVDMVVSDRRRVEQVLLNLISNAIKFTDTGEIRVDCTSADGFVQICVIDSGIGIKEEDTDKLFKAFQQVDSGITRKFEGTGLGLYVCQKLLELLGGKIWVTSRWGAGSTFCFNLPVKRETP